MEKDYVHVNIQEKSSLDIECLEGLAFNRAYQYYGKPLPIEVKDRLRFELEVINKKGIARYFLIIQDLINTMRDDHGIMIGPGCGAETGSLVAYCLGITKIDPLKHDLLFERFVRIDNDILPSFVIDFEKRGIRKAKEWLKDHNYMCKKSHEIPNHQWHVESIKMYFGGLRAITELKLALMNIKRNRGIEINLDNIPIDDPKTLKLFQNRRTTGVFLFRSYDLRAYLKYLRPTCIYDLVALYALYFPGLKEYIPSFITRKNGKEEIKYDIPCMEKYLKETYGMTIYQEQIMLLSRQLADFNREESHILRHALDKRKLDIIDGMKPKFIEGGKKNGHDPKVLDKIWTDWDNYGWRFSMKSHAVSYTMIAYQTAYLKANYPYEYMTALLESRKGNEVEYDILTEECRRMRLYRVFKDYQ